MMLWPVPNIGTIPLRADNQGLGYKLSTGEVKPINLVYEFAETEFRRTSQKKSSYESQGYTFSSDITTWLAQAEALLVDARSQADEKVRAITSYFRAGAILECQGADDPGDRRKGSGRS